MPSPRLLVCSADLQMETMMPLLVNRSSRGVKWKEGKRITRDGKCESRGIGRTRLVFGSKSVVVCRR